MSTIIVCDGVCGAQSPDPKSRLHVANNWLTVRAGKALEFRDLDRFDDKLFCKACAPRVLAALGPLKDNGHG